MILFTPWKLYLLIILMSFFSIVSHAMSVHMLRNADNEEHKRHYFIIGLSGSILIFIGMLVRLYVEIPVNVY